MKMNRSLVLLTMEFVLSLMLISAVSGSTSVAQTNFFTCNQGNWNQASNSGNLQINVCTPYTSYNYGSSQSVQYAVYYNQVSVVSGGCSLGPCSNPTAVGIQNNSYLVLRFYPSYIYGMQIIEPDSKGNAQQVWLQYNGGYPGYQTCNPYFQFCFAQNQSYCSGYQGCSAVVFRIETTPITINVFFNRPY